MQFRENVFCVFTVTVRCSPIYRYRSGSSRRLALNCHKATINYSYVSPTLATVGLLRFGIIADGRRYLSIDRILRLNNYALARTTRICMRIGSLVMGISARDNGAAYLKGSRFSREASRDINLPVESIFHFPPLSLSLSLSQ